MDRQRSKRLYDSARWRKSRARHLLEHPLCVLCERQGITKAGDTVDHIVEHNGDYDLFWDESNWQTLCRSCHSGIKRRQEHNGYSQAAGVDGMPIDSNHPWNKDQKWN